MFTLGFRFKPWTSEKAIADGPSIMSYLKETVAEYGIDKHIRYGQKVVAADWSDADNRWTVRVDRDGEEVEITASFLFACQRLLQLRRGLYARVRRLRGLRRHDHPPAALAGGPRLRGQADRGDRQRRHRGDSDSRPCEFGCGPCDDAAAVADIHRLRCPTSTRSPSGRTSMLPEKPAYVLNRWKSILFQSAQYRISPAFPEVHAQDADDHGGAPPARGLRRRRSTSAPGTTRGTSDCAWHPTVICSRPSGRARPTSSPTPSTGSPRPASSWPPARSSPPTSSSPQRV